MLLNNNMIRIIRGTQDNFFPLTYYNRSINSDIKTILRREKTQKEKGINTPYRNRYLILIKRD